MDANIVTQRHDLTVIGGGISGICAAVTAARKGVRTALVNDRSVLGGNASSEIGVWIHGASHHGLNPAIYAKEGGLIEEIKQTILYYRENGYGELAAVDASLLDLVYGEENITLYLNTIAMDVDIHDGNITCVKAYHPKSETRYALISPLYIDASGDGIVAYKAGAEFAIGSEGKDVYGESSAPDTGTPYTMGNTIYFEIEEKDHPVTFVRPQFAYDITTLPFFRDLDNPKNFRQLSVTGKFWTLEVGGDRNILKDYEDICLDLRKLIFGLWDYIKNSGKFPKADAFELKRVYAMPGTRESRRFKGDYVITENDIARKAVFPDEVLICGWPMDIHAPRGIYDPAPAANFIPVTGITGIPYRALYAKDIGNLFLAGRIISVSHIALGTARLMATCGCMGQAVGTAAFLALRDGMSPRDVYLHALAELRNILVRDDQTLIHFDYDALEDLADEWQVEASSVKPYENTNAAACTVCDRNIGLSLALSSDRLASVSIRLKNLTDAQAVLEYDVLGGTRKETYLPDHRLKNAALSIPPCFDDYMTLPVDAPVSGDGKVHIVLKRNTSLAVYTSREKALGAVTKHYYDQETPAFNHDTCPLNPETGYIGQDHLGEMPLVFKDIQPPQTVYQPQNLLGKPARPMGLPNVWVSEKGMAQKLRFTAPQPVYIAELQLLFNTRLEEDVLDQSHCVINKLQSELVKDYDVLITDGRGAVTVKQVRGNYLRLNRIAVHCTVQAVEIRFLTTYGSDEISLYGVRFFGKGRQDAAN